MKDSEENRILKCRVARAYNPAYPDPFVLKMNDLVRVGDEESRWPGWLWCTDEDGRSGWVPESYLQIQRDIARVLCDYDARELTVTMGQELEIVGEESGWLLCRTCQGEIGWIPRDNVLIIPDGAD
jgi:hypothetical protein